MGSSTSKKTEAEAEAVQLVINGEATSTTGDTPTQTTPNDQNFAPEPNIPKVLRKEKSAHKSKKGSLRGAHLDDKPTVNNLLRDLTLYEECGARITGFCKFSVLMGSSVPCAATGDDGDKVMPNLFNLFHHDAAFIQIELPTSPPTFKVVRLDWNNNGLHYELLDEVSHGPAGVFVLNNVSDLVRGSDVVVKGPQLKNAGTDRNHYNPEEDSTRIAFLKHRLVAIRDRAFYDLFNFNCQHFVLYLLNSYHNPGVSVDGCLGRATKFLKNNARGAAVAGVTSAVIVSTVAQGGTTKTSRV